MKLVSRSALSLGSLRFKKIDNFWDVIVIGCGIAGITAAIYLARYKLKTLVICKNKCGTLSVTEIIENYPGFERISGEELCGRLMNHLNFYRVPILEDFVESVTKQDNNFTVKTTYHELQSLAVIVATGSERRKLGVPGEDLKGVSYCATCDAPLFKGKDVAVIGGGNTAMHEALVLSEHARKVYIIHRRDQFRADPYMVEEVRSKPNVEFLMNSIVQEILGSNGSVSGVKILNKVTNEEKVLPVQGVLVAIGLKPNVKFLSSLLPEAKEGKRIEVNECMETKIKGL